MAFEAGEIFASIVLETQEFGKGVQRVSKGLNQIRKEGQAAFGAISGAATTSAARTTQAFSKFGAGIQKEFQRARTASAEFGAGVQKSISPQLDQVQKRAAEFGRGVQQVSKGLNQLRKEGQSSFGAIASSTKAASATATSSFSKAGTEIQKGFQRAKAATEEFGAGVNKATAAFGAGVPRFAQAFNGFRTQAKAALQDVSAGAQAAGASFTSTAKTIQTQFNGLTRGTNDFSKGAQQAFERFQRAGTQGVFAFAKGVRDGLKTLDRLPQESGKAAQTARQRLTEFAKNAAKIGQQVGKALAGGFNAARRAMSTFVSTARRGLRVLLSPVRVLQRALFSVRGALAGIGVAISGVGIVRRATQLDAVTRGFNTLTRSLGIVSGTFAKDLRNALRGTVSDLELFRATNNAVLLNVIENREQFVELAAAARRLGRALGRDATDALNDLSFGIGRQSRLILDNLGLVVRVDEANERYAQKLRTNVRFLTQSQRRTAFLTAAMDAIRRKVNQLGPDVDTVTDKWSRFGATVSNTFSQFARAIVTGRGADILTGFLERNRRAIVAFGNLIRRFINTVIDSIDQIGKNLRGRNFGQVVVSFFKFIGENALTQVRILVRIIVEVAFSTLVDLIKVNSRRIARVLVTVALAIAREVAIAISRAVDAVLPEISRPLTRIGKAFTAVGGPLGNLGRALEGVDKILTKGALSPSRSEEREKAIRDAFTIRSDVSDDIAESINSSLSVIGGAVKESGKIISEEYDKLERRLKEKKNEFAPVLNLFSGQGENIRRSAFEASDAFREFSLRQLDPAIQGIDRLIKIFNEWRNEAALVGHGLELDEARADALGQTVAGLTGKIEEQIKTLEEFAETPRLERFFPDARKQVDEAISSLRRLESTALEVTIAIATAIRSGVELTPEFVRKALAPLDDALKSAEESSVAASRLITNFNNLFRPGAELGPALSLEEVNENLKRTGAELGRIQDEVDFIRFDDLAADAARLNSELVNLAVRGGAQAEETLQRFFQELGERFGGATVEQQIRRDLRNAVQSAFRGFTVDFPEIDIRAPFVGLQEQLPELSARFAQFSKQLSASFQGLFESFVSGISPALRPQVRDLERQLRGAFQKNVDDVDILLDEIGRAFDRFRKERLLPPELLRDLDVLRPKLEELARKGASDFAALDKAIRDTFAGLRQAIAGLEDPEAVVRLTEVVNGLEAGFRGVALTARKDILGKATEIFKRDARDFRQELQLIGATPLQRTLASLDNRFAQLAETFKDDAKALGEIEKAYNEAREAAIRFFEAQEFFDLSKGVSTAIFEGMVDAFERGERLSKQWSNIVATIFRDAMTKVIDRITDTISSALTKAFEAVAGAVGIGAGGAAFATGLVGLAAGILTALENRADTTVEDFADTVDSSEAIRGVVAGPTNVAISKIGESLKSALSTTELLLMRIATAVETNTAITAGVAGRAGGNTSSQVILTGPTVT